MSDGRRVADAFTNCRWVGATLAVTNGTRHKAEEEMISVMGLMNGLSECTFHDLLRSTQHLSDIFGHEITATYKHHTPIAMLRGGVERWRGEARFINLS